jgi:hypothetical protein
MKISVSLIMAFILFGSIHSQTNLTGHITADINSMYENYNSSNIENKLYKNNDELKQILIEYNKLNKKASNHALISSALYVFSAFWAINYSVNVFDTNLTMMKPFSLTVSIFSGAVGLGFSTSSVINNRKSIKYLEDKL